LSIKYSDRPYGSLTVVWNSWLPSFYRSGARGDNGAEIARGVYKYMYGQHPMNPVPGQTPYPALNLYTLDNSRSFPGTRMDKQGNTIKSTISGVNFHWGNRIGSPSGTGSLGCHVVPRSSWNEFISNFNAGDWGYYVYIRFW
jgi:hypothetical protein